KILELLEGRIGDEFQGVVTGITKFGIFVQLEEYLIDGLIRFEDLEDDWWEADDRMGVVRGRSTGRRITIGDLATVRIVKVDVPRRQLDIAVVKWRGKPTTPRAIGTAAAKGGPKSGSGKSVAKTAGRKRAGKTSSKTARTGASVRNRRSKQRDRRK